MSEEGQESPQGRRDDPWGILVVAAFFLVGGMVMLAQTETLLVSYADGNRSDTPLLAKQPPEFAHVMGTISIIVSAWLARTYSRVRKGDRRD